MTGVRVDVFRTLVLGTIALLAALGLTSRADGQGIFGPPAVNRLPSAGPALSTGPREGSTPGASPATAPDAPQGSITPVQATAVDTPIDPLLEQKVVEIRVVGNDSRPTPQILSSISTRVDRPFDQAQLEKDVRTLAQKKWFLDVRPIREQVPGGVRITFEVIERPTLLYVKYLGNTKIRDKRLAKETELKKGSSLDPYAVEEGRRKIEEYYQSKGYNDVRVTVLEGTKPGDRGAIYMINEGESQKIKKTIFVGNTITTGGRLKTQIESKPPLFWVFKGQYSEKRIAEDIDKLTNYYRNLGFFRARISREVVMDKSWKRPTVKFVIDEGPRYKVRAVTFIGNRKFTNEQLATGMQLKEGEFYLRRNLDSDINRLQDAYGTQGYVFANVQQELRFEEEPGELSVVFSVEEGSRYAVGKIHVHIAGDAPHTRYNTVLNRLMFRPGDVVDTRKIRNAERRLRASSLFVSDPSKGQPPKITFTPPGEEEETSVADRSGGGGGGGGRKGRFQSPDNAPDEKQGEMHVWVQMNPDAPPCPDEPLQAMPLPAPPEQRLPQLRPADLWALRPAVTAWPPRWWPLPPAALPPATATPANASPLPRPVPSSAATSLADVAAGSVAAPARPLAVEATPQKSSRLWPVWPTPRWWPVKSVATPAATEPVANPSPTRRALQSSADLPPLDIAADEPLIVRGQGPSAAPQNVVGVNSPQQRVTQATWAARPASATQADLATPAAPATPSGQPAQAPAGSRGNLNPMIASLNLTTPVSLGQSLSTARGTQLSPGKANLMAPVALPQIPQPAVAASNRPAAAVAAPSPQITSLTAPPASAAAARGPSTSGFTYPGAWIVRGQSGYGGQLPQPMSPGPQMGPYAASGPVTSFGGTAAFQSPTGVTAPPQFTQPGPGMPTDPTAPEDPELPQLPINVNAEETQTGRFMFGVGVNSNAGLVGSIVIDEQNFDWRNPPTSVESWRNGSAWRGAGQHFRIELAPGTQFSRYLVSFNNPYLYDTNVNYGMSGYYFQRFYYDWYEQRLGGRVNLGYQFRPDLVGTIGLRAEDVIIKDPRIAIPDLVQVLGSNGLFSIILGMTNDTRDNTFFPTEGRYINMQFEQATGSFTYPRLTLDLRKYFVLHQRADGSGRQVLALYSYTGVSGANTPIYERFFLGGIGTIRGFYYRDASPTYDTVVVGGDFASYGTIEYTIPITADDMFRLAFFCDGGFDSRTSRVEANDIRIAPGMGVRISVPAMGPAPIAVDFAVPVVHDVNDQKQLVNFAVGVAR